MNAPNAPSFTVERFRDVAAQIEAEVSKVIVGQREVVRLTLIGLIAGGHVLLEGVPGLGKTMLVRTLADVLDLAFSRIQFTPDLMPADIVGTDILQEAEPGVGEPIGRHFRFQPGPIFANLVLADEINRATPKTQSALLEAMQEHRVTVSNTTYELGAPFFVLATQNPIEMEGTYPLPEAQLDRFLFKLNVGFPSADELAEILSRTTRQSIPRAAKVADGETIAAMEQLARGIAIASHVNAYAVRLLMATHPEGEQAPEIVRRYVRYGASPRGAQAMILGAKIAALLDGRYNVSFEDLQALAYPALCHRLILNFEGEAEGITTDEIVAEVIERLPT
jgi:MoxR-like ATPase